jgi:A/G-specific adenine glycosylase
VEQLELLPGIGPYTARAIAATAFGVPVAPLDVNVARILSRTTGCASSSLQDVADALVAPTQPRRWLNAVMDLAATVCTKASPRCPECPLRPICATQGAAEPAARQRAQVPFPQTRRWLRGRLLAILREAPNDEWQVLPDRLGTHDGTSIVAAAEGLARDGFIEVRDGEARIRV